MSSSPEVEEAKRGMPLQFTKALIALLESLATVFDKCEGTASALAKAKAILGNDILMEMGIRAWSKEIKPFEEMVHKKQGNLFKKIKHVGMVKELKLHKKWEDPLFQSRDKIWAHLQGLTQMAEFFCGTGSAEQNSAFAALDRLRDVMGIGEVDDNGDTKINVPRIASYASKLIFNQDPSMRADALTVSREFGALAGMGDIGDHLSSQLEAADASRAAAGGVDHTAMSRMAEKMLTEQLGGGGGGGAAAPKSKSRKKK